MFSLKKAIFIAAMAALLGGFGGYKIGGIAFDKTQTSGDAKMEKKENALDLNVDSVKILEKQKTESGKISVPAPLSPRDAVGEQGKIAVGDQAGGKTVTITSVSLPSSGWVAVHEDATGRPGKILGAQRFSKGTHAKGVVELLRATENGKTYYAMLHDDDGDRTFDPKKDTGTAVMTKFNVLLVPMLQ